MDELFDYPECPDEFPGCTHEERKLLHKIDQAGEITDADEKLLPGLHWCVEWEACLCWGNRKNEFV